MIVDLTIANLGVIGSTTIEFAPGLTVLTGETGAGKTLVTTALSLLLGGKADASLIRYGASDATIDCRMQLGSDLALRQRVDDLGAALDDDEVIVTRSLGARSRAIVGGRPVAAAVLAELLADRITVHGQHGQVRLTRTSDQRTLLDCSSPAVLDLLPLVRQAWSNLRDAQRALDEAADAMAQDAQALAAHRALVEDVEAIAPSIGEDVSLDLRIATLSSLEAIERATRTTAAMLADGDSLAITDVGTLIAQARHLLEPHGAIAEIEQWIGRLREAESAISGIAHDVLGYVDALESDATSLDGLQSRRAQIGALLRRWNTDLETLLSRYDISAKALALAADPSAHLEQLQRLRDHCAGEFAVLCDRIHDCRVTAAADLATSVERELQLLDLPHAVFKVQLHPLDAPTGQGADAVEFLFSANPGLPAQPLAVVGSGGELSRVMLALETVANDGRAQTFVFDEVDAGIGGKAALEVGRRLAKLAESSQVIVVTHLAQVAAFAHRHIVVEKHVGDGQTLTSARVLPSEERPRELTRLLSGVEDSAAATAHAVELLEIAASMRGDAK